MIAALTASTSSGHVVIMQEVNKLIIISNLLHVGLRSNVDTVYYFQNIGYSL